MSRKKYSKRNDDWVSFLFKAVATGAVVYTGLKVLENLSEEVQRPSKQIVTLPTPIEENVIYKNLGGNSKASNLSGSGQFNYLGIDQAKKGFGIECYAGSFVNIFKSLGIISPVMSRESFEKEYTELYLEPMAKNLNLLYEKSLYKIPKYFNDSLRGMQKLHHGQQQLTLNNIISIASSISLVSEYALKTGMRDKKFKSFELKTKQEVLSFLNAGWVVRIYVPIAPNNHYVVAIGKFEDEDGKLLLKTDDTWFGHGKKYLLDSVIKAWAVTV